MATLAACGLLAACGGGAAGSASHTTATVLAATGWTKIRPLPVARTSVGVVATPNGRIYAIGGGYAYNHPTGDAEVYDPTTGTWSPLPPMPQPRATFALAATHSGDIYAFGGFDNGRPIDEIDKFTPGTGEWTSPALAPHSFLPSAAATGPNDLIYMLAAVVNAGTTGQPPDRLVSYSPSTGRWRSLGPAPTGSRSGVAMAFSGGTLYIIGGADVGSSAPTLTTDVTTYSPATGHWGAVAPLPTPLAFSGVAVDHGGRIYVIGGTNGSGSSDQVFIYDPAAGAWTVGPALLQSVGGLGAATGNDGHIYAIGGATTVGHPSVVNTAERLTPSG